MMFSFARRLSLSDLTYAASGYRKNHPNQLVCQLVVQGIGRIPEHRMQDAVAEVVQYCPIVRARLKGFWFAKYWSSGGPLPSVRTILHDWNGQCQDQLAFIDTPLDLLVGPVAEIVQVVGRNTYLVFRVHHAVTDGVGLLEFALAFFKVLNRDKPEYYDSNVTLENMPPGNLAAIPDAVTAARIPYSLRNLENDYMDRARLWRRITLPGNDKKILLKTMLAISSLARGKTSDPVRIHMPVSLRRHVPAERSLANLIGMLRIDVAATDSDKELVRKIKQAMVNKQELPIAVNSVTSKLAFLFPLMLLHLLEKIAIKKLLQRPKFCCSGTTSHVGTVQLQLLSGEYFRAQSAFGIPVPPLGTPLMAVIMSNECLTEIVLSANKTLISETEMDDLVEKLSLAIAGYGSRPVISKAPLQPALSA